MSQAALEKASSPSHDAVILGGALTGTVLYIALAEIFAKHNKSLIILERESRPIPDSRMLSLGYAGGTLLRQFGLWDELEKHLCPVTSLSINYTNSKMTNDKNNLIVEANDLGLPALGWTIPHQKLQNVLWDKVRQLQKQHNNLTEAVPFNIESINLSGNRATIKGGDRTISSNLVFAATGTAPLPWGGTRGEVAQERINYHHYGNYEDNQTGGGPAFAVTEVKLSNHQQEQNRGYWFGTTNTTNATNNATNNNSATALALTPSAKGEGLYVAIASFPNKPEKLDKEQFASIIRDMTMDMAMNMGNMQAGDIGDMTMQNGITVSGIEEDPVIYQARSYIALDRVLGPVVLIGNAAHSVAPLGGQNYNLTLWTLSKLRDSIAEHLSEYRNNTNAFSNREFLMDYVTQTDPEIRRGLGIVHNIDDWLSSGDLASDSPLNNIFGGIISNVLPPQVIVNYFMQAMSRAPTLRNKIFARAAGLHRIS